MSQKQINLSPVPYQPGIVADWGSVRIISAKAANLILPGQAVEAVQAANGEWLAQAVQDATTGGSFAPKILGVAVLPTFQLEQQYQTYQVPATGASSSLAGFPEGYAVPVLERGLIAALWDGNTGTALPGIGAIQMWHSSDGTHAQGVFTTKAAQTTAGQEIDNAGSYFRMLDLEGVSGAYTDSFGNVLDFVLIDVNIPGKA